MNKELFNAVLCNEIAEHLGHRPDGDEWRAMVDYVSDWLYTDTNKQEHPDLADLRDAIKAARQDKFIQCNDCGEYFLPYEMNDCGGYYCLTCRPHYDPDGVPGGWDDMQADRND